MAEALSSTYSPLGIDGRLDEMALGDQAAHGEDVIRQSMMLDPSIDDARLVQQPGEARPGFWRRIKCSKEGSPVLGIQPEYLPLIVGIPLTIVDLHSPSVKLFLTVN